MKRLRMVFFFCILFSSCSLLINQGSEIANTYQSKYTQKPISTDTINSEFIASTLPITPTPRVTPTLLPIFEYPINQDNVQWFHYQILEHFGITGFITDMGFDENGDLLVLTTTDFTRFDGKTWKVFPTNPHLNIDDNNDEHMLCFMRDKNGEFWIGSSYGVVYNFNGNDWESITLPGEYAGTRMGYYVYFLVEDNEGIIWVGARPRFHQDAGLFSLKDRIIWTSFSRDSILETNRVNDIKLDSSGNIWVSTDVGLFSIKDNKIKKIDSSLIWESLEYPLGFFSVEIANNDVIWISSDHGWGIAEYGNNQSAVYSFPNEFYGNPILKAANDVVWVFGLGDSGDSEPLYIFDGNKWTHLTGFPFIYVEEVLIAEDGSIWLTTELGLYNFELDFLTN